MAAESSAEPSLVSPPPAQPVADGTILGDQRTFHMRRLLAGADLAALVIAWICTMLLLSAFGLDMGQAGQVAVFIAFLPVWLLLGSLVQLYHRSDLRLDPSIADEAALLIATATGWSWCFLLVSSFAESGNNKVLPAFLLWLAVIAGVFLCRVFVRHLARRRPWFMENVALVGEPADLARLRSRLRRHPEYGLEPVLEYPISTLVHEEEGGPAGIERLVEEVRGHRASRTMIASSLNDSKQRAEVIHSLNRIGVHVDLLAGSENLTSSVQLNYVENLPVMTIPARQQSKVSRGLKRTLDLVGSSVALLALSPLLAYCAIRVKLSSPGPVFFRQKRIGRNGEELYVLKFRSMVADAESRKDEVSGLNMHLSTPDQTMFKIPDDPRITEFGAFLRRWSLDELPQLWNVVKGEMSLVGPRPLIPEENCMVEGIFCERSRVRPGVTGPWQAHGRSDIGFEQMMRLDYAYVANWTLAEDLKLIMRTVEIIVQGRGAY